MRSSIALLHQAMSRGDFKDDGGWMTPVFSAISASQLDIWTSSSLTAEEKVERLLQMLQALDQYAASSTSLEGLTSALFETKNIMGLLCQTVADDDQPALADAALVSMRKTTDLWRNDRRDVLATLDREYTASMRLVGLPETNPLDLYLFQYRYDEEDTRRRFEVCFQEIRLQAEARIPTEVPACMKIRSGLWRLCNATGKILVEQRGMWLWAHASEGTKLLSSIQELTKQLRARANMNPKPQEPDN